MKNNFYYLSVDRCIPTHERRDLLILNHNDPIYLQNG